MDFVLAYRVNGAIPMLRHLSHICLERFTKTNGLRSHCGHSPVGKKEFTIGSSAWASCDSTASGIGKQIVDLVFWTFVEGDFLEAITR